MPKLHEIITSTNAKLKARGISSHHLDAEVLLAYVLNVNRSWLHAHPDKPVKGPSFHRFEEFVKRRLQREPIAYITGSKEFYGREFIVTPDVLIPRPETEDLIDLALESLHNLQNPSLEKAVPLTERDFASLKVVDVGTGSGCVGITIKLERPGLNVTLSDISPTALTVARKNAEKLGVKTEFTQSDLLGAFSKIQNPKSKIYFDLIVANLPYVDKTWETSPETAHEPSLALYADNGGLLLINALIDQSKDVLEDGGFLLLEADPDQHPSIINFAAQNGLTHQKTSGYALSFMKQTQA